MSAYLLVSFIGGVFAHKGWRVAWRMHARNVPFRQALEDEFAPAADRAPTPEKKGAPSVTEIA